jgi:hypothetical protein
MMNMPLLVPPLTMLTLIPMLSVSTRNALPSADVIDVYHGEARLCAAPRRYFQNQKAE